MGEILVAVYHRVTRATVWNERKPWTVCLRGLRMEVTEIVEVLHRLPGNYPPGSNRKSLPAISVVAGLIDTPLYESPRFIVSNHLRDPRKGFSLYDYKQGSSRVGQIHLCLRYMYIRYTDSAGSYFRRRMGIRRRNKYWIYLHDKFNHMR